ncbi:MAG: carbohydrate ABC transporter permease [Anaerolineales bacterium]|nr:carbohydrate ABC transporter permease [Anaerolineales bacterium]
MTGHTATIPTNRRVMTRKVRKAIASVLVTGLTLTVLFAFLIPMVYGIVTALKTDSQFSKIGAPWWPASEAQYEYEGRYYDIYLVPIGDELHTWALVDKGRTVSYFVDPRDPEAGLIEWEGQWRQLERAWGVDPQWGNFSEAWNTIDFPQLLTNTLVYAGVTTFGAVSSAALVAYGFARFRIPKKNVLFILMLSTVFLPGAVTLIPTYFVWNELGLVGTWWPLIIPAFFSWGTNVFLLRQFFLTIPRELDEAAMIDGAGPFRIFFTIIVPQSTSALTAVALFHFFYAWNDFFGPLIYLAGNPDKFPITVGLTAFNNLYSQSTNLIQAASLVSSIIPVLIFFFAQRAFMQGVVITGVEK